MINVFITNGFICDFYFFACPKPPLGVSSIGSFSAVRRLSNFYFWAFSCVGSLTLTRESWKTSYIYGLILGVVGRHVEGCQASGYVWLSVCPSVCFGICTSISISVHCPYVCGYICISVNPWDIQGGHLSLRHLCVCQYINLFIH